MNRNENVRIVTVGLFEKYENADEGVMFGLC